MERSTLIRIKGDGLLHKTTTSKAGQACPAACARHDDVASPVAARLPIRHACAPEPRRGDPRTTFRKTTDTILDGAGVTARVIADQWGVPGRR